MITMDKEDITLEAYQYGQRIGKEVITKTDSDNLQESKEWLKNSIKYEARLLPVLRELAGYENTNTTSPTVLVFDQRDCFRKEVGNCKEIYEDIVLPEFWRGFEDSISDLS